MSGERYVVGVDFGTLSGRAVLVRVSDGAEVGAVTYEYPHGVIDRKLPTDNSNKNDRAGGGGSGGAGGGDGDGRELPPDWALQVPSDYIGVLKHAIPELITATKIDPADVIGIGTDFTASTDIPVLADGTPLCELPEYGNRPHAYAKLWKHHAAQPHADRINALARDRGEPWLGRYGGLISSEWEFAKGLQLLEEDPEAYHRMDRFAEAADWIIWQLTGNYVRNACTAGYKGIYQDGRYPDRDFLTTLNPDFGDFAGTKLKGTIASLGDKAGTLTERAARWTGLEPGIAVATGNVDAHVTAPAAQAVGPGQLLAIMGTSTCHVMSAPTLAEVPGMCGVVDGGIVAGLYGYEAGQSGVGDIFAWFADNFVPPNYHHDAERIGLTLHDHLTALAAAQPVGGHGLVALDWESGNRSVLVDHALSGVIVGMTLATRPEEVYRALIEATAFGTRKIVETFTASGIDVTEFVAAGGLLRNEFLMQVYADVLRMPVATCASEQAPALGSAIHAAVAAGAYPDVKTAGAAMGGRGDRVYQPDPAAADVYDRLYAEYETLHDYFGRAGKNGGENSGNDAMHRLNALRREALS
ncbi:MAG: ribulokinase [Nocardiopsaceae bacterium]|nr:ribulokinase [Nocardiopsaceae bacterium]